jgi:hypothetical protein
VAFREYENVGNLPSWGGSVVGARFVQTVELCTLFHSIHVLVYIVIFVADGYEVELCKHLVGLMLES